MIVTISDTANRVSWERCPRPGHHADRPVAAFAARLNDAVNQDAEPRRGLAARRPWLDGGMPTYDAFLLVSFGGPEGPDEVMPFLENVTRGRGVPAERLVSVAEHYYAVGGVSPINQQCRDLLAAIRADFSASGLSLPLYWGNRNWTPYLADIVRAMAEDGMRRAIALVTSAYSSYSGCRQYLDDIDRARAAVGPGAPRIDKIRRFFNHPGFIEPFAASTRAALATLPADLRDDAHLVFTAHSVPVAMAEASGPEKKGQGRGEGRWLGGGRYVAELTEAARLIVERTGDGTHPHTLAYQSRSGPPSQPWLEPDVCDHLGELAKFGTKAVVAIPVGFVSDHMEVRHDLDIEAAESADALGLAFARAATPGRHPRFVSMITELVRERLVLPDPAEPDIPGLDIPGPDNPVLDSTVPDNPGLGYTSASAALGCMGVPSQACPADCCRYTAPAGRPRGASPA
jgi:protoporphyrin/coproporphyrin ferrochelatase